jgi:hypothetical protein
LRCKTQRNIWHYTQILAFADFCLHVPVVKRNVGWSR